MEQGSVLVIVLNVMTVGLGVILALNLWMDYRWTKQARHMQSKHGWKA